MKNKIQTMPSYAGSFFSNVIRVFFLLLIYLWKMWKKSHQVSFVVVMAIIIVEIENCWKFIYANLHTYILEHFHMMINRWIDWCMNSDCQLSHLFHLIDLFFFISKDNPFLYPSLSYSQISFFTFSFVVSKS